MTNHNVAEVGKDEAVGLLTAFINDNWIYVLNVAGSRASKDPEIYDKTFAVVEGAIAHWYYEKH